MTEKLTAGGSWIGEWLNKKKDGNTFYSHARITAVELNGSHYVVCVQEDVTARRMADRRSEVLDRDLERLGQNFETLLRVLPVAIGIANDPDCRDIRINAAFARILGVDPALNASKTGPNREKVPFRVFQDGRELPGEELPIQVAARENREIRDLELDIVRADGSVLTELSFASPLVDSTNCVRGAIGVFLDITERKAAERLLRESENQLQSFADSLPLLSWMADSTGSIFWYNRRWYEYTGTTPEQMEGWGWQSVHDPEILPSVLEGWRKSLRTGTMFEMEFPLRAANGRYRWFLTRVSPLRRSDGQIERWIGTNTDIDELREAREALRITNSELEEFAYVASHDLKEPLRTVSVYSQLLTRRLQNQIDAETNLHLGYIQKAAQRMIDLIEDLLGYSRVVYSERLDDQTADLNLSFQLAARALEEQILETGAVLTVPDLPLTAGDETQYGMIFQNLLSNSLKYHQPGEVPRITVSAEPLGSEWLISVSDNGMGFNQGYAERIFGLFQRLHDRSYPGTGLGLAICRRIVERYGGRIWAVSAPGKGATFTFSVKAVRR